MSRPAVTVAGGGMAGLTAALRLAERGYDVTVYEQRAVLGGDLASRPGPGALDLDVYPHMYGSWYHNLWALLEDAGVSRERRFATCDGYAQLKRGAYPRFNHVRDIYSMSPRAIVENLFSGAGPVADMYVFGYASVDLLAEAMQPTVNLEGTSVGGFFNGRPYMTKRAAQAYDTFITRVWGIPSFLTSADDFLRYLQLSVQDPVPAFWLPRGSAEHEVISPLRRALERAGVRLVPRTQLTAVRCVDGRVAQITLQRTQLNRATGTWQGRGATRTEDVDELVLAVPPGALLSLLRSGAHGERPIELSGELTEVARLRGARVPIVNLVFKRKLRRLPAQPTGLFDSRYCLAFSDISQTWTDNPLFARQTVLAVSASDPDALPGTGDDDDAYAMLVELADYLEFDPGTRWGDSPDVDWTHTGYWANLDTLLFVNETGSDAWRPLADVPQIENLTLAGDFCDNDVGLTTIESAVTTGLLAASAIVTRRRVGSPVPIAPHGATLRQDYVYAALRWMLAPYAATASAWSRAADFAGSAGKVASAVGRLLHR